LFSFDFPADFASDFAATRGLRFDVHSANQFHAPGLFRIVAPWHKPLKIGMIRKAGI
jgi:hypothetical protein